MDTAACPGRVEDFQQIMVDFLNNNIEPMPPLYPGRDKKNRFAK